MTDSGIITITVKCDLDNDEIFGRVHVQTTAEKSLDWLLDEFCVEKRVKRKTTFALRSNILGELQLSSTIAESGIGDGETIYAFNKNPPPPPPPPTTPSKGFRHWWQLAGIVLVLGAAGLVTVVLVHSLTYHSVQAYGIVIDAQSRSSKLFLFTWPAEKLNGTGEVRQKGRAETVSAIDSVAGIRQVQQAVSELAKSVPEDRHSKTPLLLGTTEWMEVLRKRNISLANSLLSAARNSLPPPASHLLVRDPTLQLRALSGEEVTSFSWTAINYLRGKLWPEDFSENGQTDGLLELTPDSARIAFVASPVSGQSWQRVAVCGREWPVYASSFSCYGLAAAQSRALGRSLLEAKLNSSQPIEFPCWRQGRAALVKADSIFGQACSHQWYGASEADAAERSARGKEFTVVGSSDSSRCRLMISRFFNSTCTHTSCSFNDRFQPQLEPNSTFVAVGAFSDTAEFFNLTAASGRQAANLSEFGLLVDSFCSSRGSNDSSDSKLGWRCFSGLYTEQLLRAIGFNHTTWRSILFINQTANPRLPHTNGITSDGTVAWPIGLMLQYTNSVESEKAKGALPEPILIALLIGFTVLVIISMLFACLAIRNRKRRSGYSAF